MCVCSSVGYEVKKISFAQSHGARHPLGFLRQLRPGSWCRAGLWQRLFVSSRLGFPGPGATTPPGVPAGVPADASSGAHRAPQSGALQCDHTVSRLQRTPFAARAARRRSTGTCESLHQTRLLCTCLRRSLCCCGGVPLGQRRIRFRCRTRSSTNMRMQAFPLLRARAQYLQELQRIQALQVYGRTCDALESFRDRVRALRRSGADPAAIRDFKRSQRNYRHMRTPCFCEFIAESNDLDTAMQLMHCARHSGLCDCDQPPARNLQPLQ